MKAAIYIRKESNGTIKSFVGLEDKRSTPENTIFNPVIDGIVWRGICHTNAVNIEKIDYREAVKDSATGEIINP